MKHYCRTDTLTVMDITAAKITPTSQRLVEFRIVGKERNWYQCFIPYVYNFRTLLSLLSLQRFLLHRTNMNRWYICHYGWADKSILGVGWVTLEHFSPERDCGRSRCQLRSWDKQQIRRRNNRGERRRGRSSGENAYDADKDAITKSPERWGSTAWKYFY